MTVASTKLDKKKNRSRNWRKAFLSVLAREGIITDACEAAEICRQTAYNTRLSDPGFAKLWDDAEQEFADTLEKEAFRRAKEKSDLLTIFLLKGLKPDRYREARPDQQPTINVSVLDPAVAKAALMAATEAEKGSG